MRYLNVLSSIRQTRYWRGKVSVVTVAQTWKLSLWHSTANWATQQVSQGSDDTHLIGVIGMPEQGLGDKYNNPQTTEDWLRKQSAAWPSWPGGNLLGAALLSGVSYYRSLGVKAWPLNHLGSLFRVVELVGSCLSGGGLGLR